MSRPHSLALAVALAAVALSACSRDKANGGGKSVDPTGSVPYGAYVEPPSVRTYPARPNDVERWIAAADVPAIRRHAWDVWESITTASGEDSLPVWETWYTGYEVFQLDPATLAKGTRTQFRDFERPSQFHHFAAVRTPGRQVHGGIPRDTAEMVTSFNRYTSSLANFIVNNGYNQASVLNGINAGFDSANTALAQRQILTSTDTVDATQIALKPVFQFIRGDSATVIPYWDGISTGTTTNLENPTPSTWMQGVVVDPTGKLTPGTKVLASVNGQPADSLLVVPLSALYHFQLTAADSAAYSDFAKTSGDDIGQGNQGDSTSVAALVRPGNYALLMAMHVTTKEIPNWTWQTFWWSPNPSDPIYGADRPASIPAPWSNYNLAVAYFMSQPNQVGGDPYVAFNPYLETNLQGFVPQATGDSTFWTGVQSNCMSCHRSARWGGEDGYYVPDGYIAPTDSMIFTGTTKVDFLWSIATRAQ